MEALCWVEAKLAIDGACCIASVVVITGTFLAVNRKIDWMSAASLLSGQQFNVNFLGVIVIPEARSACAVDGRRLHVCPEAAETDVFSGGLNLASTDQVTLD